MARFCTRSSRLILRIEIMADELYDSPNARHRPMLVGPEPFSLEEILRHVDPAPDEETERFVASIYADRRGEAENFTPR
jgi:hypothetical protein